MFKIVFFVITVIFYLVCFLGSVQTQLFNTKLPATPLLGAKPVVNEAAQKEVQKIRESLNNAFKADDETAAKGSVVQPDWTNLKNVLPKETKVTVSDKSLKEVADIRHQIQDAVSHDSYAKGDPGEKENVAKADRELGMEFRMKKLATGNTVGSIHEEVGAGFPGDDEQNVANVVESLVFGNAISSKLQYRARDSLFLKSIEEDLSFQLGHGVSEWKFVLHGGKEILFGVRDTDLIVVELVEGMYRIQMRFEIEGHVSNVESFSYWDTETRKQEGVILAVVEDCIFWFRGFEALEFWKWRIGKPITALRYFKIDNRHYIAVCTKTASKSAKSSMNIYQFNLSTKDFWIAQRIPLNVTCSEICFLATGRDTILVIPQNNSAIVYSFNPKLEIDDNLHFNRTLTLESNGVQTISTFQMGGYSYIALGGYEPKIFRYHRGEFVLQTIFGQNFGFVNKFLPIPARTFRDDMILLVQHVVDFESHNLTALEALIWDGKAFEASLPVPCRSGGYEYDTGVGCLMDVERADGIFGASVIAHAGNNVSIVVPRNNATSGLFYLRTGFLQKNVETVELQELFEVLKSSFDEQKKFIAETERFLANAENSLRVVKTPELRYDGEYSKLFVNDHKWTQKDSEEDLNELFELLEELDEEVRKLQTQMGAGTLSKDAFFEHLEVDDVEVKEMLVDILNGEPLFIRDDHLKYDGTIKFNEKLEARSVQTHTEINADDLLVEGNLDFDEINGFPWVTFVSSIVMRNFPSEIEEIEVLGDVVFDKNLQIGQLNGLSYPNDFLLSSGPRTSVVRARKNFMQSLAVNAIDSGGPINGINPFDVITLSENQNIPGLTTFTQLEVSERLELNGTVQGKTLGNFLSNPSLMQSRLIQSECIFNNLIINGTINIAEQLNGFKMADLVNNIIRDEEIEIEIPSKKSFRNLEIDGNIELSEFLISGINLNHFVTTNTQQELSIDTINGNLYVNYMKLGKLFNSVNVTDMFLNSIKIDEDRDTEAEITIPQLLAPKVTILENLNANPVKEYVTLGAISNLKDLTLKSFSAENLVVKSPVNGKGSLNSINLGLLNAAYRSGESFIPSDIEVDELLLGNGLSVDTINNIEVDFILSFLDRIDDIPKMLVSGELAVDQLTVYGNVNAETLNSERFDDSKVIWLNRPNVIENDLRFTDRIVIDRELKLEGKLNNRHFAELLSDIVFRSATDEFIEISAGKEFQDSVRVFENVVTKSLNEIPFGQIATKTGPCQFLGRVKIKGDLYTQEADIGQYLNDYKASRLPNMCSYSNELASWVFGGNFEFKGMTEIDEFYAFAQLNQIENVPEFFESLTYKDQISILNGRTTFRGAVKFDMGAYVKHLNGFDLEEFFENVVFIEGSTEHEIEGSVHFTSPISAKYITIRDNLYVDNLMGVGIEELVQNTLRTNESAVINGTLRFSSESLDGTFFAVNFINSCDMKNVITLHTMQNLTGHRNISLVHLTDAMVVLGDVNGVNLKEERENTLMIYGNQTITTPLTMTSFRVLKNLETMSIINDIDLRNAVPLNGDIELRSPVSFNQINVQNVIMNDLISGLDFTDWANRSLWQRDKDHQVVTGNWSFGSFNVRNGSNGDGLVNSVRLEDIKNRAFQSTQGLVPSFGTLREEYADMCKALQGLVDRNKDRLHFLRYFEMGAILQEDDKVNLAFSFTQDGKQYLLTNVQCHTNVYLWQDGELRKLFTFESGSFDQILSSASSNGQVHISTIVGSKPACAVASGVHTWIFTASGMVSPRGYSQTGGDISQIHHDPTVGKLYAIDRMRNSLFELHNATEHSLLELTSGEYRFLPADAGLGVALSDGKRISVIDQTIRRRFRQKRDSSSQDIQDFIAEIAKDLISSLNFEIVCMNTSSEFTQDVSEDHIEEDLLGIVEELKKEDILSGIDLSNFTISDVSPIELSGIRVVLAIWSSYKETEELLEKLSTVNDTAVIEAFLKDLNQGLKDILSNVTMESKDSEIFERTKRLKKEILPRAFNSSDWDMMGLRDPMKVSLFEESESDLSAIVGAGWHPRLLVTENPFIPDLLSGEVIALKVGSPSNRQILVATTEYQEQQVSGDNNVIKIYSDIIQGMVFQTIPAQRPRSLTVLSIRDETVLAFVDNVDTIRAFVYRGIRGFVEISDIKVESSIRVLTAMVMPPDHSSNNCWSGFLVAVIGNSVRFFNAVMHDGCEYLHALNCS